MKFPNWLPILYILIVSATVLAVDHAMVVLGILGVQMILWAVLRVPLVRLRPLKRILSFTIILVISYGFFYGQRDVVLFTVGELEFGFSVKGFIQGGIMGTRIVSMLLATFAIRYAMPRENFLAGVCSFGVKRDHAMIIEDVMDRVSGQQKTLKSGKEYTLRAVLRGETNVAELVGSHLTEARTRFKDNDLAIIASLSLMVTVIRFMKIAPGLPIAPGHKNVLLIPLLILGASLTKRSFGATAIGLISGIIHFSMGFGKFGPLGILQFAVMGLVIDLMLAVLPHVRSFAWYAIIGAIAGLVRIAIELGLAWLVGLPVEGYLVYLPLVISQCAFGALSAFLTIYLIKRID